MVTSRIVEMKMRGAASDGDEIPPFEDEIEFEDASSSESSDRDREAMVQPAKFQLNMNKLRPCF